MEKQEIKKNSQAMLFDIIRQSLPANLTLAGVVSELLGLSMNTTYTRLRGEKPLLLEEAVRLCRQFGISLDKLIDASLVGEDETRQVQCSYYPMLSDGVINYLWHVREASEKFKLLVDSGNEMFVLAATDIPPFNIFMFPELAMFRYFSWSHQFGDASCYERFVESAASEEIMFRYRHVADHYLRAPSTEIWTEAPIIGTALQFLDYHSEMGHFVSASSALALCGKLTELTNTLEEWATTGSKGAGGVPFKLYISGIDIGNTFVLFKNADRKRCWLKLFTMHGLVFSNEELCTEVESWMVRSLQRATLISGSSAMERYKFFDGQRQKIDVLVKKISG
jgi:hypothetical protein